ncbi:GDSL esterase/lipase At5g45960 [Pistacia vera]|uniref:GDSL esterase/lipase At5g45960 n=1 Tax=Pistacia vera TaxID=55513 RepID=UPI001263A19D|nr:GDSL esterase/lipase At5g45960 [Pistacia vera]
MEVNQKYVMPLLFLFLYLPFFISIPAAQAAPTKQTDSKNTTFTAFYVFGDSTVDPGNNDYIDTAFRSNFPPYGKDFYNHMPTGRFSKGRLTTDFAASYVGIKESVPPYLDPTLSMEELITGVSFASAASGLDPLTARINSVIDMAKQLEYFKEYKRRVQTTIGKQRMENHIKKAGFLISSGTNDFMVNYFSLPFRRQTFTVSAYQQFMLRTATQFIQSLWKEEARIIAVSGLPPMGCLPAVITLFSDNANILERGCIEKFNTVARDFNRMLQNEVNELNITNTLGARLYYVDIYAPLIDMIQGRSKVEFDDVSNGCCGTGYLEAAFLCNPKSYVCADASKYVFWDSIHPTEETYGKIFNEFRFVLDNYIKM